MFLDGNPALMFPNTNPPMPAPAAWAALLTGGYAGLGVANAMQEYKNGMAKLEAEKQRAQYSSIQQGPIRDTFALSGNPKFN